MEAANGEMIIYNTDDGKADVRLYSKDGVIWMNQQQMALLFDTSKPNISMHISNVLQDKELDENSVIKDYLTTAADGKHYNVTYYALPMVLAVGFRVRSVRGTQFRKWANKNLTEFLQKGFVMDYGGKVGMIKRINRIKNLGVFSNYTWNSDLRDFEEKNIIYGWNYSGKTTISRLFSYLDKNELIDEDYKTVEFEIELADGKKITNKNRSEFSVMIKVFNSDFIKNNLHFDSNDEERKITGIKFAVGDTGDILDQIRVKEKYIEKAKSVIEHISAPISVFTSFDSKFTSKARELSEILNLGRSFTKRNIDSYVSLWNGKDISNFVIKDEQELSKIKTNATSQNTGTLINTDTVPKTSFINLLKEVEEILSEQPTKSDEDEILSSDTDLYNWAKSGLSIYTTKRKDLKKCAFCGGDLFDTRLQELNAFYSNEAAKVKSEIEQLKTKIVSEKDKFANLEWSKKSENDLTKSLQAEYAQKKNEYSLILKEYKDLLDSLLEKLNKKFENSLFLPMELGSVDSSANNKMVSWIESIQQIFIQSNDMISEFEQKKNIKSIILQVF